MYLSVDEAVRVCIPFGRQPASVKTLLRNSGRRPANLCTYASHPGSRPPKLIRSQNNQKIKHCVRLLTSSKYRSEQQKVILSGLTLLEEIGPYMPEIDSVFYIGSQHEDVLDDPYRYIDAPFVRQLLDNSTSTYNVTSQIMSKLCNLTTVQDTHVAAEVDLPAFQDFLGYVPGTLGRLLVLERCQDPGNLGTLLRSCVAFGFDGVFLLPGCADPFNDKTIRASRGASFRVPMMTGGIDEWEDVVARHGLTAIAADIGEDELSDSGGRTGGEAKTGALGTFDALDALGEVRVSLVVGSEGQGLSEEMRKRCRLVSIPMSGDMESLNVATAASIIMCLLSPSGSGLVRGLGGIFLERPPQ